MKPEYVCYVCGRPILLWDGDPLPDEADVEYDEDDEGEFHWVCRK